MIRSLCGGLALAVCSLSVLAGAPRQDDLSSLPMRFALHQEGPAEACGANCRLFISASGMITADTPRDFDAFVRDRDVRGATMVFDSKGGSVLGAIALGRAVRSLGLGTTVGRVKEVAARDAGTKRITLLPRADCQSMCAFVLLGGVRRFVPAESRVLVHQIWLGDRRDDAAAASYSAEDLVLVQRDIGKLVQYTLEMGGGAELLEVALRIPPWEPMRALSREELRRTRLDISQDRISQEAGAKASSGTASPAIAIPASDGARTAVTERGWAMVERQGRTVLVRRHPLTIEGDRIGTFEVALGCGTTADTFTVSYAESRRSSDSGGLPASLKQVALWIEEKTNPLEIISSRLKTAPRELDTLASGAISVDLVKSFATAFGDSLTVRTSSSTNPATMIRIGNTGLARHFPQLAATCAALPPARQDTRTQVDQARFQPANSEK